MKTDDLMKGMNHIDDELLEEAMPNADHIENEFHTMQIEQADNVVPMKPAGTKSWKNMKNRLQAIAAVAGVSAAALLAVVVVNQNAKIARLEKEMQSPAAAEESAAEENAIEEAPAEGTAAEAGDVQNADKDGAPSGETTGKLAVVGQASGENLGDTYTAATDYESVYDLLTQGYGNYEYEVVEDMAEAPAETGLFGGISNAIKGESSGTSAAMAEEKESMPAMAETAEESAADAAGAGSFSGTNVVTEGVDESDIVKTDGSYIYMVLSGSVEITDIRDGEPGKSTRLTLPFEAPSDSVREMYVDGENHRMIIITDHVISSSQSRTKSSETVVFSYDITDPMNASLIGKMRQDGNYHTSRKIGNIVYLFTDQYTYLYTLKREDALTASGMKDWAPFVNGRIISSDCIYLPEYGSDQLIISSFNVDDPECTIDAKCIIRDYSNEYVSSDAIYLYQDRWSGNRTVTEIDQLFMDEGRISIGASTTVSGSIYDTFAINDNGTYVRVLTTDYSGTTSENILYVLDKDLKQVGRIDGIARGEQIYAARYLGDMAYFITYRNTDPMFVADLSDPTNPVILGNVEISGFSDYLHIWDDTHVLGIGYETSEDSWMNYVKLVMFDVSDPANPQIEHVKILRTANYCYGTDTYKALLVSPGRNLIGFTGENYKNSETSYYLYSYDSEKGFTERISEKMTYNDAGGYRGLYSGDWFYIAGDGEIKAFNKY